jgi:hypothetical protein
MGSRARRPAVLAASCLALAGLAAAPTTRPADLILTGGFVYTMDATRSAAEAVAVRDGRIVYVGTPSEPRRFEEARRGSWTCRAAWSCRDSTTRTFIPYRAGWSSRSAT